MVPVLLRSRTAIIVLLVVTTGLWWTNPAGLLLLPNSSSKTGSGHINALEALSDPPTAAAVRFIPSERVRVPHPGEGRRAALPSSTPPKVSRVACVAQDSSVLNRVCRYENVCVAPSGTGSEVDDTGGHKVTFYMGSGAQPLAPGGYPPYAVPVRFSTRDTRYAPAFVAADIPARHVRLPRAVTMLHHWAAQNLGHILWEDLGGIWQGLRTVGLAREHAADGGRVEEFDVVAIETDCSEYGCGLLGEVVAAMGGRLYTGWDDWAEQIAAELELDTAAVSVPALCFDLALGGPNSVFQNDAPSSDRLSGREPMLYDVLTRILTSYALPWALPPQHRVIITHKSESMWAQNAEGRHRAIANHEKVADWIREAYPGVQVDIVEWHLLSFYENVQELGKTSVLITPYGGVSMLLPFLPPGAHAIVMDYMKTVDDPFGGESRHMDYNIWDHFHHLRIDYYTIDDTSDYVWDFHGATDARNDASISIKKERILDMIEAAFQDMAS